jgi:hypothetical protein
MPREEVERRGLVEVVCVIARRHRQLVEVDEQCRVDVVDLAHGSTALRRA